MNRNKIKISFFLILFTAVLFGSIISSSTASSSAIIIPIGVQRPQGLFQSVLHGSLLWLITNMESADFTPDNVYYGVYNSVGTYSYPITGERNLEVTIDINELTKILNNTINRLENDIEPTDLTDLKNLYTELLAHTEVTIYIEEESDLSVTTSKDHKAVTILYDNDRSVLDVFEKIKNNESIAKQPFTGDEIITNVLMSLIRDEISGYYSINNTWDYEDGSDATLLKEIIHRITDNRWLYNELSLLFRLSSLNKLRTLVQYNNSWYLSEEDPRVLEYGRFQISQLKIDKLELRKIGEKIVVSEYDYKYLEHHFLGNLVYNDTNGNGMMDIGVKTLPAGIAYPTIGDEAQYRFDIKDIASRTYTAPQTTEDDVLEFGSEFENVEGVLQPIEKRQDETIFDTLAGQAYNIDEISTLFHFSVNNTDGSTNLKFDYVIGDWNNSDSLEGYGFCQLMASTVVDAHKQRTFQWKNEYNAELGAVDENASRISRFRLTYAEGLFGEIRLDEIPYYWSDTQEEVNAIGQLIPLNLIAFTYGRVSSEADLIRIFSSETTRKTFLYSVSYPKWDGKSITHDPSYVVIGGIAAEESDDGNGIPGFEFVPVVLAIPMIAFVEIYRRKRR